MKKSMKSIVIPIIWLLIAGIWSVNLWVDISKGASILSIILKAVCVVASLVSAVSNFHYYKNKEKNDEEK